MAHVAESGAMMRSMQLGGGGAMWHMQVGEVQQ